MCPVSSLSTACVRCSSLAVWCWLDSLCSVCAGRSSVECSADQCKQRRSELENDVKMLRRELKARDEDVRQLELETQVQNSLSDSIPTLWPAHCCHMGTATKHRVSEWVKPSFVIFDIRALWHSPKRQSARMSKITNDGLTHSDTRCFVAVPIWQQWASKGSLVKV